MRSGSCASAARTVSVARPMRTRSPGFTPNRSNTSGSATIPSANDSGPGGSSVAEPTSG